MSYHSVLAKENKLEAQKRAIEVTPTSHSSKTNHPLTSLKHLILIRNSKVKGQDSYFSEILGTKSLQISKLISWLEFLTVKMKIK